MARVAPGQFVGGENCFAVRRAYAKNRWGRIRFGEGRAPGGVPAKIPAFALYSTEELGLYVAIMTGKHFRRPGHA